MPFAIGSILGASQSDILAARFGRNVLVVGLGLVAAGITAVWLVLALSPPTEYNGWQLLAPLLVAGIGSAIGIAVIGTILFGTLHVVPGPDALATAFGHSATLAMGVSAVLSVAAFALVFALPRTVEPSRLDDV
jgi:hypothetical protein